MTALVYDPTEARMYLDERRLEPQAVQRLPAMQPGDTLICVRGIVWVTQAGDDADYLLHAGDAFIVLRPGVVVVQALTPAIYRLSCFNTMNAGSRPEAPGRRSAR